MGFQELSFDGRDLISFFEMYATGLSTCWLGSPGVWNSGAAVHPRLIIS